MGLGTNEKKPMYLSIHNGKIVTRVKTPIEGSVTRKNSNNEDIHELIHDYVEGIITGINTKEVDIAGKKMKFWVITMIDKSEKFELSFPFRSGPATGFLMTIENLDVQRPIRYIPSVKEVIKPGSSVPVKKVSLFAQQEGKVAKWKYTKDNPGDLPPMEQVVFKGDKVWDDSNRMNFLVQMIEEKIKPNLPRLDVDVNIEEEEIIASTESHGDQEDDLQDLPF